MARCLVIYDITDDRIGTKVADICQHKVRVKANRRLGKGERNMPRFPICEREFRFRHEVGVPWARLPLGRRALRIGG